MIRFSSLILLFVMFSCTEGNILTPLADAELSKNSQSFSKSMTSEVDQFGIIHNQAMDEIVTQNLIAILRDSVYNASGDIDTLKVFEILIDKTNEFTNSLSPISIGNVSYIVPELQHDASYYRSLFTEYDDVPGYFQNCVIKSDGLMTSNCIRTKLDSMVTNNAAMEDIASVSILEYSMIYWFDAADNSSLFNENQGSQTSSRGRLNWWAIGFADYVGAGGGAALGPGGAIAGGVLNSAVTASIQALSTY
ncbi:hypothetical protein [Lewinella sp. 4G2]|uniref:hypothetical protein n=1 Tax=Lewinella sp. 4G2 TaxID=1803372 RepID=UPI0007B4F5D6|nr:hypothetical protein [Lewinella sp. 4G2]OAV45061.1 hypothetical protein A3850_011435 [Lewinella sp. 4G2]